MDKLIIWLCRAIGIAGGILTIEGIITTDVVAVIMGTMTAFVFAVLSIHFEGEDF